MCSRPTWRIPCRLKATRSHRRKATCAGAERHEKSMNDIQEHILCVPTCRLKYVKLQVMEQDMQSLVHNVQPQSVHQVISGLISTC